MGIQNTQAVAFAVSRATVFAISQATVFAVSQATVFVVSQATDLVVSQYKLNTSPQSLRESKTHNTCACFNVAVC